MGGQGVGIAPDPDNDYVVASLLPDLLAIRMARGDIGHLAQ